MKFLMLVCVEEDRFENDEEAAAPDAADAEDSGSFPWLDDVIARGIRLDGDRLRPAREARTVLVRDGEVLISDGPFAETKEDHLRIRRARVREPGGSRQGGRSASGGGVRQDRGQGLLALTAGPGGGIRFAGQLTRFA